MWCCWCCCQGKWTNQSHKVAGHVGLLITSLAEHCGCIRPDLTIAGPAHLAFHMQHLPYQQLRPMVDAFAAESHAQLLASSRAAFKRMLSFDKDTHRAAMCQLPPSTKALVLSAQSLTMSSAGKRFKYFGEGSGNCPFCGDSSSGIIHESWCCPAFKKEQDEEDAFLSCLGPHNVPTHVLLGLPEQLEACYSDQLIRFLPGQRPPTGTCPDLCCDGTLTTDAQEFLVQLCAAHPSNTATSIAYMLKANTSATPKLSTPPIMSEAPSVPTPTQMAVCATPPLSLPPPPLVLFGPTGLRMIGLSKSRPTPPRWISDISTEMLALRWQAWFQASFSRPRERSSWVPSLLS